MNHTIIDLPVKKREAVVKNLNQNLATLIDLRLQAKFAHWNVRGPHFIALHELFDKVVDEVDAYVDEVAERLTALGGTTEATVAQVAKASQLPEYPADAIEGPAHVTALAKAVAGATQSARLGIDFATEPKAVILGGKPATLGTNYVLQVVRPATHSWRLNQSTRYSRASPRR